MLVYQSIAMFQKVSWATPIKHLIGVHVLYCGRFCVTLQRLLDLLVRTVIFYVSSPKACYKYIVVDGD